MTILERFLSKRTGKNTKTACKDTAIDNEIKSAKMYWQDKRLIHRTLAFGFLLVVLAYIFGVCLFLYKDSDDLLSRYFNCSKGSQKELSSNNYQLAALPPQYKLTSQSTPEEWVLGASKYSRIVVFFIFLLWGARLLTKLVFFQMYLWEDAAEKVVAIETYIAFQKSSSVRLTPKEREIFLKTIFRNATMSYHNKGITEPKTSINLGR